MPPETLKVKYNYYDVRGKDRKTVYRQMHRWSMNKIGKSASGLTEWRVSWRYQYYYNKHNVCTRFNVTAMGEIIFSMPRLTNYHQASPKFKKKWDIFYRALQFHEDGHALHGVQALKEIMRLQPRITSNHSCQVVAEDFNARARKIIDKFQQKDIDYDNRTQHGLTQGIVL